MSCVVVRTDGYRGGHVSCVTVGTDGYRGGHVSCVVGTGGESGNHRSCVTVGLTDRGAVTVLFVLFCFLRRTVRGNYGSCCVVIGRTVRGNYGSCFVGTDG